MSWQDANARKLSAVVLAAAILLSFGAGAGTYAVWTDSESADTASITLADTWGGSVTFIQCWMLTFEPDDPNDFTVVVGSDQDVHEFDQSDFDGNLVVTTFGKLSWNEQIRNATLDGTTYVNSNYPDGC